MKTIIALYNDFEDARKAVVELEAAGFSPADLSVVTSSRYAGLVGADGKVDVAALLEGEPPPEASGTGAGALIGAGFGLLAGLAAVTVPGVGLVAAAGPILAGGVFGAVAGGLVGSLVDAGVPAGDAEQYTEGVRRGGTLVTVRTDDARTQTVTIILGRHNPVDLGTGPPASAPLPAAEAPDPTGRTTMGDAAAAMPPPDAAVFEHREDTIEQADPSSAGVIPHSLTSGIPNGQEQLVVGRDVPVRADQAPLPQRPPVGPVQPIPVSTSPSVQPDTDEKDFQPDLRKDPDVRPREESYPGTVERRKDDAGEASAVASRQRV